MQFPHLVTAVFLLFQTVAAADAPLTGPKPNIVLIVADDLGWGDLGCYGQEKIRTPHLDRMAAEGMRFTKFYAGSTVCAPSRSVLMTGLHTGHTRVRGNAGAKKPAAQTLRPEDVTMAEVLKTAGYSNALFGKWGLGDAMDGTGHPRRQGFDRFFGYLNQVHAHNHYPDHLIEDFKTVPLKNDFVPAGRAGAGYSTNRVEFADDLFADRAVSFLAEKKDAPFFLLVSLVVPHANNERTRALGDGMEVPDLGEYAKLDWPKPDKAQAACVTRLDSYVGRIRAELEKQGLTERTLVLFTSDNGPHAEGGNRPEFFKASGPWSGRKRSLTDGGVRVPFLACMPGTVKTGVSGHVGYFGDLLTTFAALAGAVPPAEQDGLDLMPVLRGKGKAAEHPWLYWEFHESGTSQALLMDGRWKAIRAGRQDAAIQLFDQENDPGEARDVAAENPDRVRRAVEILTSARTDSPDWPLLNKAVPR